MSDFAYPVHTERLELRPFTPADLDDVYAYHRLPEVVRYLYWEPRTEREVRGALERRAGQHTLIGNDYLILAVVWPPTGRVLGEVSLDISSRSNLQGEIGFVFHPEAHGRGIAAEASRWLLRQGFETVGLHRIAGRCDARNTSSARLMERLGMRREAHFKQHQLFKGEWDEEFVYAILAEEWRTKQTTGDTSGR